MKHCLIAIVVGIGGCSAVESTANEQEFTTLVGDDAGLESDGGCNAGNTFPPPDPTAESPIQLVDASAD